MIEKKNTIVTGSNGFIGNHLIKLLLANDYHVHCLDMSRWPDISPQSSKVTFHRVDLTNPRLLLNLPVWDNIKYVFHLAGVTRCVTIEDFRVGNVIPTKNILNVLIKKKVNLKRFLFISSQAAAGPAQALEIPTNEAMKPQPIEAYGISKLEGEQVVKSFRDEIPFTIIRPCAVYGPRDKDFLNIFRYLENHLGIYLGCKDNYLSIIYVKDLVEGILRAAMSPKSLRETYFLCSNAPIKWKDLYTSISQIIGKYMIELNIPQLLVDLGGQAGDFYSNKTGQFTLINSQKVALSKSNYWVCTADKASLDFDFKDRVSLVKGLTETYHWYKEKRWL